MPVTFASVDAHLLEVCGLLCCNAEAGIRADDEVRSERIQLRAAYWQVNDMLRGGEEVRDMSSCLLEL